MTALTAVIIMGTWGGGGGRTHSVCFLCQAETFDFSPVNLYNPRTCQLWTLNSRERQKKKKNPVLVSLLSSGDYDVIVSIIHPVWVSRPAARAAHSALFSSHSDNLLSIHSSYLSTHTDLTPCMTEGELIFKSWGEKMLPAFKTKKIFHHFLHDDKCSVFILIFNLK